MAYAVETMNEMVAWDAASRLGNVNTLGLKTQVNESDDQKINDVLYDDKGDVIKSIPAVDALGGSVSFILEWNGMEWPDVRLQQ